LDFERTYPIDIKLKVVVIGPKVPIEFFKIMGRSILNENKIIPIKAAMIAGFKNKYINPLKSAFPLKNKIPNVLFKVLENTTYIEVNITALSPKIALVIGIPM